MLQWHCEVCNQNGSIENDGKEMWFKILGRIDKDHKRASPNCKGNAQKTFKLSEGEYSLVDENGVAIIVQH